MKVDTWWISLCGPVHITSVFPLSPNPISCVHVCENKCTKSTHTQTTNKRTTESNVQGTREERKERNSKREREREKILGGGKAVVTLLASSSESNVKVTRIFDQKKKQPNILKYVLYLVLKLGTRYASVYPFVTVIWLKWPSGHFSLHMTPLFVPSFSCVCICVLVLGVSWTATPKSIHQVS